MDWISQFPAVVFSDGQVMWNVIGEFNTQCDLILSSFPFDSQVCSIEVCDLILPGVAVNVTSLDDIRLGN